MESKGIFFRYRFFWHFLFWLSWYLFYSLTYGAYNDLYREEFIINLYLLPVRMAATYTFIYLVLPIFMNKKKYALFGLLTISLTLLFGLSLWLVLYYFCYCPTCILSMELQLFNVPKVLGIIGGNYGIPATAAAIMLFKKSFIDQKHAQELEKGKIEAELKYLKAQIHPHFLFNTLNNLYALTLKKSDKAPDVVLRLSDMLDYILYNSNEKEVKLVNEIKHIATYIELEKIRYGERLKLDMIIRGNPEGKYIAPLILLPFVENSFKHGASSDMDQSQITIDLDIRDNCLNFEVSNTYCDHQQKESYTDGIGLKNVKRRLELIYPDQHELKIQKQKSVFNVFLYLCWSNNKEMEKSAEKMNAGTVDQPLVVAKI